MLALILSPSDDSTGIPTLLVLGTRSLYSNAFAARVQRDRGLQQPTVREMLQSGQVHAVHLAVALPSRRLHSRVYIGTHSWSCSSDRRGIRIDEVQTTSRAGYALNIAVAHENASKTRTQRPIVRGLDRWRNGHDPNEWACSLRKHQCIGQPLLDRL